MTKPIELIYSRQDSGFVEGRAYSNPRFYSTPRSGVSKVFLVGDWPKIQADYEALGIPVARLDSANAVAPPVIPPSLVPAVGAIDRATVAIPADWRDLPWTKPNEAGMTMRGLAAVFSDEPVLNKAQAAEAIETELRRRHTEEEGSNGLTRREMNADIVAAGIEADPTLSIEDLVEFHALAKAG